MKYLKVHDDLAISTGKIQALKVTGHEDNCHVSAFMENGEVYRISVHKNFQSARIELSNLISRLEGDGWISLSGRRNPVFAAGQYPG